VCVCVIRCACVRAGVLRVCQCVREMSVIGTSVSHEGESINGNEGIKKNF